MIIINCVNFFSVTYSSVNVAKITKLRFEYTVYVAKQKTSTVLIHVCEHKTIVHCVFLFIFLIPGIGSFEKEMVEASAYNISGNLHFNHLFSGGEIHTIVRLGFI